MNKRFFMALSFMLILGIMIAACGPTPTTAPPPPPAATTAPEPTKAPEPTAVPAVEPTAVPAVEPTKVPKITITLWHAWTGAEETVLKEEVGRFMSQNSNMTVELLAIPFDQLQTKFTTEAGAGGGPDIIIGPTDWVGPLAEAGLLAPLDDLVADVIGDFIPSTVDALRWQGILYGFPESFECVAMYYNTDLVDSPPADTDELKAMAADVGLGFNIGFYNAFGYIPAFGGQLFDDDFKCVLDQGGTADYLNFMLEMSEAEGVEATDDYGKLETLFKEEQVGLIFNGPWASGDYTGALGEDKVAVAPMPMSAATGLPTGPFLGVKHFMLNANSDAAHLQAAIDFVKHMTSPDVLVRLMNNAGHLPANMKVEIPADNMIINGFIAQAQTATPFPNAPEMGAAWTPGGDMIKKVIAGEATAEDAVLEATQLINEANNK